MSYRNLPMVPRVVFGRGSLDQLNDIIAAKRKNRNAPFIFLIDDVFKGNAWLTSRIALAYDDRLLYISTVEEPKTAQVDSLVDDIILSSKERPSGIIGIGGGSILDLTKAVSILLTNEGNASDYQGCNLVRSPAIYHVGVPTLSGTGAESSAAAVLTGPENKQGIISDYAPFDQVILDPELTKDLPRHQWFYTGMNCYIQCIETLNGTYINAFSESYSQKAYALCLEVFEEGKLNPEEAQDKLMMASWHGGMSSAYAQVGIAQAMSYGLSSVLETNYSLGNCIVFNQLEAFYPEEVKLFKKILRHHNIELPKGLCKHLEDHHFDSMIKIALGFELLWENTIGKDWKKIISLEQLKSLYKKM